MGILWGKHMIANATNHEQISPYQWGAVPGRQSGEPALLKVLSFELSAYTRTTLVEIDKDCTSCFDRIVSTFSDQCDQHWGLSSHVCAMLGKILDDAQYHIKTKHGISSESYCNTNDNPLYGLGQGNRCGPSKWTNVSTKAMNILDSMGISAKFQNPTTTISAARPLDGFVDDVACWINRFAEQIQRFMTQQYEPELSLQILIDIIHDATRLSQKWERLLWCTGGALNLEKCFYYVLHWTFDDIGNPRLMTKEQLRDMIPIISITDHSTNLPQNLEQYDLTNYHRTLGFILNPMRTMSGHEDPLNTSQFQVLRDRSITMANSLRRATISPHYATRFTESMYITSVGYPLQVTSFTRDQLHKIQSPYTQTILNKLGYCKNFPTVMVFGPKSHGAIGQVHLYNKQGTDATLMLLRHLRMDYGLLFETLTIAIQWFHHYAGTEESPLVNTSIDMPHLLPGWMKMIRDYMRYSHCSLWLNPKIHQPLRSRRLHDRILMETICRSQLTKTTTTQLGYVRLFLQVDTLADIYNTRGSELYPRAIHWEHAIQLHRTNKIWPIQAKPNKAVFDKWRSFLRKTFCVNQQSNRLRQKLGQWTRTHRDSTREAYFNPVLQYIFIRRQNSWHVHELIIKHGSKYNAGKISETLLYETTELPLTCIPTQISDDHTVCDIPHYTDYPDPFPELPPPIDFPSYCRSLPPWERQLLAHCKEVDLGEPSLLELIQTTEGIQSLFLGSDGGAQTQGEHKGTGGFGWAIATHDRTLWKGRGPVVGYPDNSSYRTEHAGALSLFRFLYHYFKFYRVPFPDFESHNFTDSQSMIDTINKLNSYNGKWYSTVFLWNHIDISQQLYNTMQDFLPLQFSLMKVKAHTKDDAPLDSLTPPERVNRISDEEASSAIFAQTHMNRPATFSPLPNVNCYLKCGEHFVTSHEKKILLWTRPTLDVIEYYANRHHHSRIVRKYIDWNSFTTANNKLNKAQFTPKLMSRWLPTFTVLHKRENIPVECPQCHQPEDNDHIFLCPSRIAVQKQFLRTLKSQLLHHKTSPYIITELTTALQAAINGQSPTPTSPAGHEQQRIGWINLFRGMFSARWASQQQEWIHAQPKESKSIPVPQRQTKHAKKKKKKKNSKPPEWMPTVVHLFLKHSHSFWIERCQSTHTKTINFETEQQRRRANAIVTAMYDHEYDVCVNDRQHIFDTTLEEKLKTSAGQLLLWADMFKPVLHRAIQDFKNSNRSQTTIHFKKKRRRTKRAHKKSTTTKHHQRSLRDADLIRQIPLRFAPTLRTRRTSARRPTTSRSHDQTQGDNNHPT